MKKIVLISLLIIFRLSVQAQNTGIGTVSPTDQLHTTGTVRFQNYSGPGTRTVQMDSTGRLLVYPAGPVFTSNAFITISDTSCASGNGVVSPIAVNGQATAVPSSKICVRVNIGHTWDADLRIFLVSPGGAVLSLAYSNGGSGDNFTNTFFTDAATTPIAAGTAPFTGRYKPAGLLGATCGVTPTVSTFAAIGGGTVVPNGNWTLKIFDASFGDVGYLISWDISFSGAESIATQDQNNYIPKFSGGNLVASMLYQDTSAGRIGIGTITPGANLEVASLGTSTLKISSDYTDTTQLLLSNGNLFSGTNYYLSAIQNLGLRMYSRTYALFGGSATTDVMYLSTGGNVGIGITTPTNRLQVAGSADIKSGGLFSMYKSSGLMTVQITPAETASEGSEMTMYNGSGVMTIDLDADNGVNHRGRLILDEIQIKGGSDFAEDFSITKGKNMADALPGMLVSIDPKRSGSVAVTNCRLDKKVIGVISGANGIAAGMLMGQKGTLACGDHPVALAGRVYVLATDEGGEISPGDFITSSSTSGYAMKAGRLKHAQGAIIGKAMSVRDPKTGFVLVLINLQ